MQGDRLTLCVFESHDSGPTPPGPSRGDLEPSGGGSARVAVEAGLLGKLKFRGVDRLPSLNELPLQAKQVLLRPGIELGWGFLDLLEETREIVFHFANKEDLEEIEEAAFHEFPWGMDAHDPEAGAQTVSHGEFGRPPAMEKVECSGERRI